MNYDDRLSKSAAVADRRPSADVATRRSIVGQVRSLCGFGAVLSVGFDCHSWASELLADGVDATAIRVVECGGEPGNLSVSNGYQEASIMAMPFDDGRFETVLCLDTLECLPPEQIEDALKEMRRVARRNLYLRVPTTTNARTPWRQATGSRSWWENQCYSAGWRKHPRYYQANDYAALQNDPEQIIILLERIPDAALSKYPLQSLREERDLHMDMLREAGSRSDAHVYRYQLASQFVRPGDYVLDAACGLGYGSHLIRTGTRARKVIGIDGSSYASDYATACFDAEDGSIEFREGFLPECLAEIPDSSVDLVISFETLEHVEDPQVLLAEFWRVLSPGGRLIASVPNDWSDETGKDPNPFHFHVYTLDTFRAQLQHSFAIEKIYSQNADRVKRLDAACEWVKRPRSLTELRSTDQDAIEAEWWLAVAIKSPLAKVTGSFEERHFTPSELRSAGNALAFGRDYENPWLVRSLVSMGLRTESKALQVQWSTDVLAASLQGSADRGAVLTLLCYRSLEGPSRDRFMDLVAAVDNYLSAPAANPNAKRWGISLRYVCALMLLRIGEREKARSRLQQVLEANAAEYSVTLLTKTAEAAWLLGIMLVSDGRASEAKTVWAATSMKLASCLARYWTALQADFDPPLFEIREVSMVAAHISRLQAAAKVAEFAESRPTVFYDESTADLIAANARIPVLENELYNLRGYLDDFIAGKTWLEENRILMQQEIEKITAQRDRLLQELEEFRTTVEELKMSQSRTEEELALAKRRRFRLW